VTDFRALCEELNGLLEYISDISPHLCEDEINNLTNSARAALAEQPVGPTDEELLELQENLWNTYKDAGYRDEEVMYEHSFGFALDDFARAVLARWGTPNLAQVRSSLGEVVEDDVDLYLEQ